MPPLAEATVPEEFNHDDHMSTVKAGLEAILVSEDINEIKSIAQSLLSEEQSEQKVEEPTKAVKEPSLEDYLGGK